MRAALRRAVEKAFLPLYDRFDRLAVLHGELSARMDELARRIGALEGILAAIEGRTGTTADRQYSYEEDQARLTRRLDEIEKLLAERQP